MLWKKEYNLTIGYLGPNGSFTSQAAAYFASESSIISYSSIATCLRALEKNELDYAIVPVENSIEGTVNVAIDFIYHHLAVPIQCELVLPIHQQLMVHPNFKHSWQDNIVKIVSHPQALAQTQTFLADNFPHSQQLTTESTTSACELIVNHQDDCWAAVASKAASEAFNLTIVCSDIQDNQNNETRFWLLGKETFKLTDKSSCFIRQTLGISWSNNQPGDLHRILSVFSWRQIDLSKIESRPLRTKLGEYYFLIDILVDNPRLIDLALEELAALDCDIKILGTYPVYYGENS
ncbi:prephenate dehydratase [Vagococcus penaei]|uniref:prephenate dehydratase n=1 Tax=Vagococcus penaei TaxID=633807 RepID=UPI001FCFFBCF|nr:prephenate dehydratase [Vagococcus penaei]